MSSDILSTLNLVPADVPDLPARERNALIAHLLRWGHDDVARRCLQQLLATHSQRVTVYDNLARACLNLGEPGRALEIMRRRHALRASCSSRALEAQIHLAAGDLAATQEIARELIDEHPDALTTWRLQTDVCLAAGDMAGAEAAVQHREELRPDSTSAAQGFAQIWQARGDNEKALLWARTALARTERDERRPPMDLLHLLETLYRATGQQAQAEALAARREQDERRELEDLRKALCLTQAHSTVPPPQPSPVVQSPSQGAQAPTQVGISADFMGGNVIAGAVDLTSQERDRLEEVLGRCFTHHAFRPGQADVIAAILRGESVLAVMPTGSGKSLCYQLAAQLLPGVTLVVSPLIALMKDQLDGLPVALARHATTLNSTLDGLELEARLARVAAGDMKLLYAAPERLRQRPFLHALKRAGVSLLVVDEAHCVSLWGHDFRPDYRFIARAWQELGRPPILGMTATATPRVQDDVRSALGQMRLIAIDVHRPNLHLEARHFSNEGSKRQALLAICQQMEGSGIVYARSRQNCEQLAKMLQSRGVPAIHYHAGIGDRAAAQDRFMQDNVRVVVATIAFGMGVDKADVRFIVHYNPPKSLENYYQEAGRAGRDGLPARCSLFYTPGDQGMLTRWSHQEALSTEFLRQVYAAVRRRLDPEGMGLVALPDLERDLVADSTQVRVAVHFLETAGLLWRGFDLPRTARLSLNRDVDDKDAELARFVEAAHLRAGQAVSRDLITLSREGGLDPRTIEDQLLAWDEAGWLRYRGIGRDMFLALPEAPPDSRQRVAAMMADHRAGLEGRLAEIMAYARTLSCRHGHVSAYFGGRPIEQCKSCDNCLKLVTPAPAPVAKRTPGLQTGQHIAEARLILESMTHLPYPLGRTGLSRALQGAPTSPVQADRFPHFGVLVGWTQKAIRELTTELVNQGLLEYYQKGNYSVLRLTAAGRDQLKAPVPQDMPQIAPAQPSPRDSRDRRDRRKSKSQADDRDLPIDYDKLLYESLRAWRLGVARKAGQPPYVVFHDTVLQRIAAQRPASLEALSAIKGIGPRKLEQYGQAILDIIASQSGE